VATGTTSREGVQPHRGWTDAQWESAVAELTARGLLDDAGHLTEAGAQVRSRIEADTDRLAAAPVERLGGAVERVLELAVPLSRTLIDSGVVPVPNPMGVPRP
jgi:hypothetical protein